MDDLNPSAGAQASEAGAAGGLRLSDDESWRLLADAARKRSATYGLLSRLYRVEVDPGFMDELKSMRFPAKTGSDKMDEGYRLISSYLGKPGDKDLELRVDYVRAFIGEGTDGHSAAYPYESVYTSEHRLRMQDARDEVLAVYRSEGLDKDASWHDDEDHVALELEFMQYLCDQTVKAVEADDEDRAEQLLRTQGGFLEHHLCNWAPLMTADMRLFAKTGLYLGLASLTDGWLELEESLFEDLLADEGGEPGAEGGEA